MKKKIVFLLLLLLAVLCLERVYIIHATNVYLHQRYYSEIDPDAIKHMDIHWALEKKNIHLTVDYDDVEFIVYPFKEYDEFILRHNEAFYEDNAKACIGFETGIVQVAFLDESEANQRLDDPCLPYILSIELIGPFVDELDFLETTEFVRLDLSQSTLCNIDRICFFCDNSFQSINDYWFVMPFE